MTMTNTIAFRQLMAWEWRRVAASKLLWLAVVLLAAIFLWGASSTAQLHREQQAAQRGTLAYAAERDADMRARVERFRAVGPELPYWQDPTGVTGYARYFMQQYAIKPHLPLSVLAVGGSDLQPHTLPVKIDTLFGVEPVYEFENPRGLGLGAFDLAFAVVYLLPLVAIAVVALLGTFERDRGLLRLIAAQPVSPRHWLGARVLAIAGWLVPAVVVALLLALWVSGVSLIAAPAELAMAVALLVAYLLFWIALSFVVLASWPSAPTAMSLLTACWLLLTLGVPVLADAAITVAAPEPSRAAFVDRQRKITTAMTEDRERILAQLFAARADLAGATARIPELDGVTRNSFFTPAIERELESMQAEFDRARTLRERASSIAGYVIPPLGFADALSVLAGTDAQRHRHFEAQIRAYQLRLREFFYPRFQREIVAPTPRAIAGSMGRFSFVEFAGVPTLAVADDSAGARLRHIAPLLAWMLALTACFVAMGCVRLRRWPADL